MSKRAGIEKVLFAEENQMAIYVLSQVGQQCDFRGKFYIGKNH